jgi:hypothetical protein
MQCARVWLFSTYELGFGRNSIGDESEDFPNMAIYINIYIYIVG